MDWELWGAVKPNLPRKMTRVALQSIFCISEGTSCGIWDPRPTFNLSSKNSRQKSKLLSKLKLNLRRRRKKLRKKKSQPHQRKRKFSQKRRKNKLSKLLKKMNLMMTSTSEG